MPLLTLFLLFHQALQKNKKRVFLKTKFKSRLNQTTLYHALSIKLHSKNIIDYDPKPTKHYWNNRPKKQMHFFFKKQKSKEAEELEENSDAVIVVNYLEENNAMEEKKTMR